MRYSDGWAHDPTWSRHKQAKPTYTDLEDDTKVDPMMPIGSTSKTWSLKADDQFWQRQSGSEEYKRYSSQSSTQWRPRLRSERDFSSVAGDASEGSAALPRLGSTDECEGEAPRDWRARHPRHLNVLRQQQYCIRKQA